MPLSPEQANLALSERHVGLSPAGFQTEGERRTVDAIRKLPGDLRATAYALIHRYADGKPFARPEPHYQYSEQDIALRDAAFLALIQMPLETRTRLLTPFFPRFPEAAAHFIRLVLALPYQHSYQRQGFRAPKRDDLYVHAVMTHFHRLHGAVANFDADLHWFAEHAAYINNGYAGDVLGKLFAAAIDMGDDAIYEILVASARGEHPTGAMGRQIPRALLTASRPDGWTFVENMLIAAQREEGLRQIIFEAIDEAHPDAFRRMLRLIIDRDLARFSSLVRAIDVWLGYAFDSESATAINKTLQRALAFLEDRAACVEAVSSGSGEDAYLALWAIACEDVDEATPVAEVMIDDPNVERRYAAVLSLTRYALPGDTQNTLVRALDDPDTRIALTALHGISEASGDSDAFEWIEALVARLPKVKRALPPLIWPWGAVQADRSAAADRLVTVLGQRSPKRLLPYLELIRSYHKIEIAKRLVAHDFADPEVRRAIFAIAGGRDSYARHQMFDLLAKHAITPEDALYFEGLLHRKADDLRRGAILLLKNQAPDDAIASSERLLSAKTVEERLAGLELLLAIQRDATQKAENSPSVMAALRAGVSRIQRIVSGKAEADDAPDVSLLVSRTHAIAEAYQSARAELSEAEKALLTDLIREEETVHSLTDALGLMNPSNRTPPTPPQKRSVKTASDAALKVVESLEALIHEHRATPITVESWNKGRTEALLGDAHNSFPSPNAKTPIEEDLPRFALRELWETWLAERSADMRDADGLELVRAYVMVRHDLHIMQQYWNTKPKRHRFAYHGVSQSVLAWLIRLNPVAGMRDFALDAMETLLTDVKPELPRPDRYGHAFDWRDDHRTEWAVWRSIATAAELTGEPLSEEGFARLWRLSRWLDAPLTRMPRHRPGMDITAHAFALGIATDADVYDALLGERAQQRWGYYRHSFEELREVSRRKSKLLDQYPKLRPLYERARDRILEIELRRGALPTTATSPALSLVSLPGAEIFIRILNTLGKQPLARIRYGGDDRTSVFSHLLRIAYPLETDTPEDFAARITKANIPTAQLIAAAVFAPQWARYIEVALDWRGFEDAVYWIHAHTKEHGWFIDQELRETWAAEIASRTPLSAQDLLNGAVDVAWFNHVYGTLGEERWAKVYDAAKYASSGTGHARARLYADVMTGAVEEAELLKRVQDKRYQDAVRAVGLLPLPKAKRARESAIYRRYRELQEFLRTSRKFGSQRRASEALAVSMALDNLARTAGYADPQRLAWAMEARESTDLRNGSIDVTVKDVTLTLQIDPAGRPQLTVRKDGKLLKNIPAAVKKHPDIAALRERKKQIEQQYSRMRASFEAAMCREDSFTGEELRDLCVHPVLSPMLEQLVFIGVEDKSLIGYPVEQGAALFRHDAAIQPLAKDARVRVAHPFDLLRTGDWSTWQRECFISERIQPFKQVFRELYVLTDAERADGNMSRRYAGHQVQPNKAQAVLGSRGWVSSYDTGTSKTYHHAGITVSISGLWGFGTPAEVEGATLEGVHFWRTGEYKTLKLDDVPPIVFSEAMRDLDLAVSVAHRGGIDPEATASTVEMRGALVRETCALLKIQNVRADGRHATIDGMLGRYSVHLSSATVHRQPGGALCIIPVHAQHRGRLFLPFADDDPKTAEVISKVILLARDNEIKDPTILSQIYAAG